MPRARAESARIYRLEHDAKLSPAVHWKMADVVPAGKVIHAIFDNYAAHKLGEVRA